MAPRHCAQEVMHHLFDLPLTFSSRQIANLDLRPKDDMQRSNAENGMVEKSKTDWLQKYIDRKAPDGGESLKEVTLFDFVSRYEVSSNGTSKKRPRAKPCLLNIYPRYTTDEDHYEERQVQPRM